jgi:cell division protein FtsB
MSEDTNKNQIIRQYLLGSLSESETERLDELSFTDDEFAESLRAAENDLVDAYVHGEVRGAELERFNAFYLATPVRRERVKFARAFQAWSAQKEVGSAVAERSAPKAKRADLLSGVNIFGRPRPALQWSLLATALVLLMVAGVLLLQNARLRRQTMQAQARHDELLKREQELQEDVQSQRAAKSAADQEIARLQSERESLEQELEKLRSGGTQPANIVSFILSPPLRGVGQIRSLSVPPGTTFVKMVLQLEMADYSAYRVSLIDPVRNQTLWRSGTVKPLTKGVRKTVDIGFPAGLLQSQNYTLRVTGTSAAGEQEIVGEYSFRVVR